MLDMESRTKWDYQSGLSDGFSLYLQLVYWKDQLVDLTDGLVTV